MLLGGSLLVGLVICEIGLRALGIAFPDWFIDDPVFGRALRPGASGWWTKEGRGFVHITADGRRGPGAIAREASGCLSDRGPR